MAHATSRSVENLSITTEFSLLEISRPVSVLPLSLSIEPRALRVRKSRNSTDLTQPYCAALPSPPDSERSSLDNPTPYTQASKAIDAFPFPLQPSAVKALKDDVPRGRDKARKPHPRCFTAGILPRTPSSSPDRYIPRRRPSVSTSQSFRLGKSPHHLSVTEKLLRQNSASPDPFTSLNPTRNRDVDRPRSRVEEHRTSRSRSSTINGIDVLGLRRVSSPGAQGGHSSLWNVGSATTPTSRPIAGISDGRGGRIGSGTNAPMYTSRFLVNETPDQDMDRFERRLALACDVDQSSRVFRVSQFPERPRSYSTSSSDRKQRASCTDNRTVWRDSQWVNDWDQSRGSFFIAGSEGILNGYGQKVSKAGDKSSTNHTLQISVHAPRFVVYLMFNTVLDAPQLRDDYYCSLLAYSHTSRTLAVGLNNRVYLWSETFGVQYPRMELGHRNTYVTSLSFSSTDGGHSILAIGRNDGQICLWSLYDEETRFQSQQPQSVACLLFKPVTTRRPSKHFGTPVATEELLVGDEVGNVYYYSVEWISNEQSAIQGWNGTMNLMAKISVHTQQICGIAWSPDGDYFATGGNDNDCCLFDVKDILNQPDTSSTSGPLQALMTGLNIPTNRRRHTLDRNSHAVRGSTDGIASRMRVIPGHGGVLVIPDGRQKHKWHHSAAVKAIAFCPWQRGLIATGGGSNDRAIHFYHTFSGACLATITVQAQVTSLIWSTTRREIAATFGYAQPEHPYRIAVFSWPDCRQVVAIPWSGEMRALYAISYPGGPNESTRQRGEGGMWWSRTAEEGCLVVASSDESVKFHEVWSEARKSAGGSTGLLGGSDILESLEGIDKEGAEVIR